MESNYGYLIGKMPDDNIWITGDVLTLKDNSTIICYEGNQSKSDDNVVIIGNSYYFTEWLNENIKQEDFNL